METRKPYPSDVSDEEWAFVAPYLTLLPLDAAQRQHDLREVFNALRYLVRAGCPWRMLPNDLPQWPAVYQQTQQWLAAGSFEAIVHDLRVMLRLAGGRNAEPSAAIFDARTMQSTPESGARAGYDGHKRKKGSKVHTLVSASGLYSPSTSTYSTTSNGRQLTWEPRKAFVMPCSPFQALPRG